MGSDSTHVIKDYSSTEAPDVSGPALLDLLWVGLRVWGLKSTSMTLKDSLVHLNLNGNRSELRIQTWTISLERLFFTVVQHCWGGGVWGGIEHKRKEVSWV